MLRSSALIAAVTLCLSCTHQVAADPNIAPATNEAAQIYGSFLDSWTGKDKAPINVSVMAKPPSAEEFDQFSDCANENKSSNTHWLPAEPIDDLNSTVGNLSYVRLVDPDEWSARDPRDLMAQGQATESAVETGVAHGLLTLSAIAFDEPHKTAAFTYSFVCGGLCGNGSTVIFKRTQTGWVQSKKQCGGWISQTQRGRPNNSFKPKSLRGSA